MSDVEREPAVARDTTVAADGMPSTPDYRHLASQVILSSSEAIVATTFDGTIIYWNPAAEKLYGWTADEVLGQNIMVKMSHLPHIDRTRARRDATTAILDPRNQHRP